VEAQWKMSQNRSVGDRARVIAASRRRAILCRCRWQSWSVKRCRP